MDLIYYYLFNARIDRRAKKSDKARSYQYYCSKKDECEVYKNGGCILRTPFYEGSCPYGQKVVEEGYTARAKKYYDWINKQEEKFKDYKEVNLDGSPNRILLVGDYYFLPYSFIKDNKNIPFEKEFSSFVKKENFTNEVISSIVNYKPKDWFNNEIRSYQKEIVPKILKDLNDFYPDIFKEFKKEYPELSIDFKDSSLVGRKAFLYSLNKNIEIIHKKEKWYWDGEYLTTKEKSILFLDIDNDSVEVRVKPKENFSVIITDMSQVNSETKIIE